MKNEMKKRRGGNKRRTTFSSKSRGKECTGEVSHTPTPSERLELPRTPAEVGNKLMTTTRND